MSTNGTAAKTGAGIAGVEVKVSGSPLDPEIQELIQEVRIEDHVTLPDSFQLRISDPGLKHIDTLPLDVGADVEISLGAPEANRLTSLIKGQVVGIEPEFRHDGVSIVVRGFDHSHQLNRSRANATFQDSTVGEVVKKVAQKAGLKLGKIEDAGGAQPFIQQSNETDWDFMKRLASRIGHELAVVEGELHMRKAGGGDPEGEPITLKYGENLLSFRPRLTGVQQVEEVTVRSWDHSAKRAIESVAKPEALRHTIGVARDTIAKALGGGAITVADAPVGTQEEADAFAKGIMAKIANSYVEADGSCQGNPKLRAGVVVKIEGVGKRFTGDYRISSAVHVFKGSAGYETRFKIAGDAPRSLTELLTPASKPGWDAKGVQVAVVTQNEDPDNLGRVRVRYPELGEQTEGWWARIASPGSGKDRGLLMTPLVDDEVLVAFEHGDVRRPYVIGALWNGKDTPGDLVQKDGSFRLRSSETIGIKADKKMNMEAEEELTVKVGQGSAEVKKDGTIEAKGKDVTIKGSGSITIEAQGSLTIKAGSSLDIKASGTVSISGAQVQLG
jgi:uncharacterized protein involved in type VI secretion and phage assembly